MARPPAEWPIPLYDLELRERLVICYTLPAAAMLHQAPAPLTPTVIRGRALCSVTFASGRVLKRAGTTHELASEFHLIEIQTPVAWSRPCSATERGLFTLHAASDHPGLNRLLSRCAKRAMALPITASRDARKAQLTDDVEWRPGASPLKVKPAEPEWPKASIVDGLERSEVLLARPAYRFFEEAEGSGVRAVCVRDYARSTRPTDASPLPAPWLSQLLQVSADDLSLDHALLQKRVTQTVFFPSERIVAMPRSAAPIAVSSSARRGSQRYARV